MNVFLSKVRAAARELEGAQHPFDPAATARHYILEEDSALRHAVKALRVAGHREAATHLDRIRLAWRAQVTPLVDTEERWPRLWEIDPDRASGGAP